MYVTKSGYLVFKPQDPIAVRSVLTQSKVLMYNGEPHIAVKHELDAVVVLRNIGVDAPSPVNFGWDYPGRYKPWAHQKATVEFLTVHRKAFVLSDMGAGKTSSCLWAAEYLKQQGLVDRVVIVCPKSCTHKVWVDELFKTLMHRSVVVIEGSRARKLELAASDSDYVVVNHDGLATIEHVLKADKRISLYIYDEASKLRNSPPTIYKPLKNLVSATTRLWLLTATPCPHSPTDAWALARLVRPELVPPYFTTFKRQTMIQVSNFKWVPKPESTQMAYDALQPAIRFKTSDCVDLPPVTYQDRSCELSQEQKKMLKDMSRQFVADKDGATITAANAAVKMLKLLQLSAGAVYDDTGTTLKLDAPDRIATLKEIVEEASYKVIVWCPFKHVMQHVAAELAKQCTVAVINGDVSSSDRADIITRFQDESNPLKVLIAHPATAAHGLTLTAANICVWYGPTFSAELYLQANARIIRPGQKNHMTVIHLASTALEWEAYGVANTKVNRQQKILDLYRKTLTSSI